MGNIASTKGKKRRPVAALPPPAFRWIDGRRFNNLPNTVYPLPSDEKELDRLSLQHFLYRFLWKGNFCSPVERKLKTDGLILDIGCGPGAWILEMASQYQRAKFFGLDFVPIFPAEIKPSNITFLQTNVLEKLPFKDGYFDFVHLGLMNFAFTEDEWKSKVIPEVIRVTKDGGWLEIEEIDTALTNSPSSLVPITDFWIEYLESQGINPHIAEHTLGKLLADTEKFSEIHHRIEIIPYTEQAGQTGKMAKDNTILYYKTIAPIIITQLGNVSATEYEDVMQSLPREFEMCRSYHNMHRIFAQKAPAEIGIAGGAALNNEIL
ncbi:1835_t:CDS:2 [Ambispora gerdemannii]|uniref:1835_t:CDS:1 n=1 Tax=Ambispora gerdemannii TaxID=144530 RepID=A0A9N9FWH5_9GLOM|nr:1835_t:CDS:2 [Ambispora gerdemannii]